MMLFYDFINLAQVHYSTYTPLLIFKANSSVKIWLAIISINHYSGLFLPTKFQVNWVKFQRGYQPLN